MYRYNIIIYKYNKYKEPLLSMYVSLTPGRTQRKCIVLAAFSFTLNRFVSKNCLATPKHDPDKRFLAGHFVPTDVLP